jgi:MYXO-CTERM domain-containing protein
MFRTGSAVLVIALLLFGALPVPSAAAFPEYSDDVFTWRHVNPGAGPTGPLPENYCRAVSAAQDPQNSPCTLREYHMGNTDTHVFFRWVLATTEMSSLPTGHRVRLEQTFGGSLPDSPFGFKGELVADGTITTVDPNPADWGPSIEWEVGADTVVAAIPLALIATKLAGGAAVGSHFNVTMGAQPTTRVYPTSGTVQTTGDQLEGIDETNQGFTLQAWGSLQAPPSGPETIIEDVVGFPVERTFTFTDPTSEVRLFNWSMNGTAFVLQYTVAAANGSAALTLKDTTGVPVFEGTALSGTGNRSLAGGSAGNWTLEVVLEEFVGSLSFILRLPAPGGEIDDGGLGGDGNGTDPEDPGGLPEDEDSPGPGLFLVLAVLGAAAVALRRRR